MTQSAFSTVLKNEIAPKDKLDLIGAKHCTLHLFRAAARLIPLVCWHGIAEERDGIAAFGFYRTLKN